MTTQLAVWTANGQEISAFLKEYPIDILLISESYYTDTKDFKITKYMIPNIYIEHPMEVVP